MKNVYVKNIKRTITKSLGRYLAIMSIIALGVGFFSGLKATKPAMVEAGNTFIKENRLFDFELISSIGFTDDEIDKLIENENVKSADGAFSQDFIYYNSEGEQQVLIANSITEGVNELRITEGRMPMSDDECVLDAYNYGEDMLGEYITIGDNNSDDIKAAFKNSSYKVVGLGYSPEYLNNERGTTSLGNGRLSGFVYIQKDGFNNEYYNRAYLVCQNSYDIYTDEYDDFIEEKSDIIKTLAGDTLTERSSLYQLEPKLYVLDRSSNTGYVCFESDSSIVQGIAKVFPVFFFLIAALVCSTTMTRMVEDERGQIGTLRALGYSNGSIINKYLIYSGSAAIIGCLGGFFLGSLLFPKAIWQAYKMLYGFGEVKYYFQPIMLLLCIFVSLICSVGTTFLACKNELRCMPSELIRPKAPTPGKRILLERIGFIWKHMRFLHKVTARNVMRFKKRMFMMLFGIAGCTALVMTGLGLRDSIANIADFQYEEIETHDIEITYAGQISDTDLIQLKDILGNNIDSYNEFYKTSVEYHDKDASKTVYLSAVEGDAIKGFMDFHMNGNALEYPGLNEVMISEKLAEIADVSVGDEITFTYGDNEVMTLTVSSIFENYVWHYAYITPETYKAITGTEPEPTTMYINLKDDSNAYEDGARLSELDNAVNVLMIKELRERVGNMMDMLNSVIWLVIACAGALAFIVLFNLSNINITERVREIATIKVLGFYPFESGSYVFRENLVLTIFGIVLGLPLGVLLHSFVMSQIQIDMVSFKAIIMPGSYLLGIAAVLLFLVLVDLIMRRKIEAIDMAESLKSVE